MNRHGYHKDPNRDGMCTCGQGRAEDVHNLMSWRKSTGIGFWYSGVVRDLNVTYRIRTRLGVTACWWPEFSGMDAEDWQPVGDGNGVPLVAAKAMAEAHREGLEVNP